MRRTRTTSDSKIDDQDKAQLKNPNPNKENLRALGLIPGPVFPKPGAQKSGLVLPLTRKTFMLIAPSRKKIKLGSFSLDFVPLRRHLFAAFENRGEHRAA